MNTFVARLMVFVALALATLTAGCVKDEAGVVPASSAVEVPGIQGAWKPVGRKTEGYLVVSRTSPNRYFVIFNDKGDAELIYEGVFFVPIPGVQNAYAVSLPAHKDSTARYVFLLRVRDQMMDVSELGNEVPAEISAALAEAGRYGVRLMETLPPNSADALFKLYSRIATHKSFSGFAFRRNGWFAFKSNESMTVELADAALARNDIANAVKMLESLASRGHAGAQYRLAGMYATGKGVAQQPTMAIFLYKSAYRAKHPQAAGALAHFLTTSGLSGKPGYDDAINWYAVQAIIDGKRDASMAALRGATFRDCSKRTDARPGDSAEACAGRMAEFHLLRSELALEAEDITNNIVEKNIIIAERMKAKADYDNQIQELQQEKKRLRDLQRR